MPIIKVVDNIIFDKDIVGITLWPFVFIKKGYDTPTTINHESIHVKQQGELLVIPFYILYVIFWLINKFTVGDAYYKIAFEKESYENENDMDYLKKRKPYAWVKYI